MDTNTLIYLALLLPTLAMAGNMAFARMADLRDGFTFVCALLTFACVLGILSNVGNGTTTLADKVSGHMATRDVTTSY